MRGYNKLQTFSETRWSSAHMAWDAIIEILMEKNKLNTFGNDSRSSVKQILKFFGAVYLASKEIQSLDRGHAFKYMLELNSCYEHLQEQESITSRCLKKITTSML